VLKAVPLNMISPLLLSGSLLQWLKEEKRIIIDQVKQVATKYERKQSGEFFLLWT